MSSRMSNLVRRRLFSARSRELDSAALAPHVEHVTQGTSSDPDDEPIELLLFLS